jgi:hypothetical protein
MRGMRKQFFRNERRQVDADARIARHRRLHAAESGEPPFEMHGVIVDARARFPRAAGDRAHDRKRVAHAMLQFGEQKLVAFLGASQRGHVNERHHHTGDEIVDAAIGQDAHDIARLGDGIVERALDAR